MKSTPLLFALLSVALWSCTDRTYQPPNEATSTNGTTSNSGASSGSETTSTSSPPQTSTTREDCGGRSLGEEWVTPDGCGECICTQDGPSCAFNDACIPTDTCSNITERVELWVSTSNTCTRNNECMILRESCGSSPLGCFTSVRVDTALGVYDELLQTFRDGNCQFDCGGPCERNDLIPLCVEGRCQVTPTPSPCAEFGVEIGESWSVGSCSVCTCTEEGPRCDTDDFCAEPQACGPYEHGAEVPDECGRCGCSDGEIVCDDVECPRPEPDPALCDDLERNYERSARHTSCNRDEDCHVLDGLCGVGLGGCYEVTNTEVVREDLTRFGPHFVYNQCTDGVCDCAEPPQAVCEDGECVAR